ncbi:MAG: hypothetical protein KatS3mg002_1418 [Candidatus Woesearchaeota archaeon]|nr:MAG: hypothetical protein KatS3mg002_1418 [Candidatus Woesearchaeota archaeon]
MTISFEVRRKIMHVFLGVVIVFLIYYDILEFWMSLSLLLSGILISLISRKKSVPIISVFLMKYDRPEHFETPGKGVISIFSSISVLLLFMESGVITKNVVLASLMIWSFGDSTAAVFGKIYGRNSFIFSKKSLEGTVAGIIAATIGALFFVPIYAAFPAALLVMIIEGLENVFFKRPIDDNILVPLLAASIISFIL